MFNEKEIQDKLNSLAMEALEEMYQDGIDKSFNHVEEIKIYETEGLRRNLKAQISSIKSLMSAARERGDESAVKEYESHLENLRSKRNSVKEDTLYTFENGEIVECVVEGKKEDMIRKFMSHDPETAERIIATGKKERQENKSFKSAKKEINKLKKIGEEDLDENENENENVNEVFGDSGYIPHGYRVRFKHKQSRQEGYGHVVDKNGEEYTIRTDDGKHYYSHRKDMIPVPKDHMDAKKLKHLNGISEESDLKVGQTVKISNNHPNKEWRNKTATIHKVVVPNEHYQVDISGSSGKNFEVVSKHHIQESLDEELKVGDKVIVRPPSYPHMKWEGKIVKKSKHGKDFHRVEYEYDGMGGGKSKHTDTFHKKHLTKIDEEVVKSETTKDGITIDHHHNGIKHVSTISDVDGEYYSHKYDGHTKSEMLNHFRNHVLPKGVKEAEKTLWDEKKDKWLEKFTKDQKEKKKDKEVNENKLEQRVNYFDSMKNLPKHLQSGDDGSFEGHIHFKAHNNKQKFSDNILKSKISDAVHTYSDGSFSVHAKNRAKYEKIIRTAHKHGLELNEDEQLDEEIKVGDKVIVHDPHNLAYQGHNHGKTATVTFKDERKVAIKLDGEEHGQYAHMMGHDIVKKLDEQLDEAARHFVYKHWPDLMEFRQVGKKGGYASKEEAQKHADKFNANKDKHEIEHHYTVKSIGVVKEDEEQLDEISKKLAHSYAKKMGDEIEDHAIWKEIGTDIEAHRKLENRKKGLNRALDRLTKESTKLDEEVSFDDYKKKVKALGYTMSTKNYSDFSGVSKYKHKEHGEFNASSSIHSKNSLEKHKELNALRQEHKGKVFDGMRRVIV